MRALGVAAGVLLAAQAFRIDRRNPPVEHEIAASVELRDLLRRACYDCHSNATVWPWYGGVAPASWLLAHDVREGRRKLNFSGWGTYGSARRAKALRESAEEVAEGEMPPWYYRLLHREARLTPEEVATLRAWAASGAPAP
jgi:hypothetical protein